MFVLRKPTDGNAVGRFEEMADHGPSRRARKAIFAGLVVAALAG